MPLISDRRERRVHPVWVALSVFFRRYDLLQIFAILSLMAVGVLFVYGIGQQVGGVNAWLHWRRQLQWGAIGLGGWFVFSLIDYRKLGLLFLPLYPAVCALLAILLFFGTVQFGARRWLSVAGFSIQPSEFAKVTLIGITSWLLSRKGVDAGKFRWAAGVLILAAVPAVLIALQPNYGTALVTLLCALAILFASGVRLRYPLILLVLVLVTSPLVYRYVLKEYHRERIAAFLNPEAHKDGKGWNQIQSKLAVGSGGFSGKGFMHGTQNEYGWLPQTVSDSDFIFSVIAEETGFTGSALLIFLYTLLMLSIFRCAMASRDAFGRYLCAGAGTLIGTHTFVNIAMNIGLLPVAGLPLPLVSYGGTFMMVTLSLLGILQSVYAHRLSPDDDGEDNEQMEEELP